jgi:hypothetical protein
MTERPGDESIGDPAGPEHAPPQNGLAGWPEHAVVLQVTDLGHETSLGGGRSCGHEHDRRIADSASM